MLRIIYMTNFSNDRIEYREEGDCKIMQRTLNKDVRMKGL
jgi:hypothetical protein